MLGPSFVKVLFLAVAVGVCLIPSPIDPEPCIFEGPPPALDGPLAVNARLQRGRRLFSGQLKGPESFTADQNGNIYTGTVDGKLWRINDESLTFITQMGRDIPECGTSMDYEPVCGRPHGLLLDRGGQLIVANTYQGLFKVDPWTGEKTLLHSSKEAHSSQYNVLLPKYGLILELGPDREVIDSLHDPMGSLTWAVSDVFQQGAHYYLGSTNLPFLPVLEKWS